MSGRLVLLIAIVFVVFGLSLLGAFESWRTLEPGRQARAKAVLEDLAAKSLSTDSYEIVTKTLGGA